MDTRQSGTLQSVGKRLPRVDARERVTGGAIYPADLKLPGMLHGKMLRSPHAHARIRRIDTTRAEALPGVLAVVTAADFPELPIGASIPMGEAGYDMWMVAQINMARGKVFWVGQPVAAVAAVDVHVAEAALALIEVDYEPLPAVVDLAAAMAPDAPVLHEHVFTKGRGAASALAEQHLLPDGHRPWGCRAGIWLPRRPPRRSASPSTPPTRATSSRKSPWPRSTPTAS